MQFKRAKLVSGRIAPSLELVDVIIAKVRPQHAGQVIKALAAELPLGPLQHLKRVRKPLTGGESALDILLTTAAEISQHDLGHTNGFLSSLPEATAAALSAVKVEFAMVSVPRLPPDNRGQWEEWAKIWPMFWKVPTGTLEVDGDACSPDEHKYFEEFMLQAFQLSQVNGGSNTALIVDPSSRQVVGQGLNRVQQHPLAHAVMEAVEAVAARDRELWPVNLFAHAGRRGDSSPRTAAAGGAAGALSPEDRPCAPGAPCTRTVGAKTAASTSSRDHTHHLEQRIVVSDQAAAEADLPSKRRRCDEVRQQQQQQQEDHCCDEQPEVQQAAAAAAAAPSGAHGEAAPGGSTTPPVDTEPSGQGDWASKPYLCTGYDCFVVREPCTMCAMALVHSRIARVVYCLRDEAHGALGSSYRLHSKRSLNHHYKVYHMVLVE